MPAGNGVDPGSELVLTRVGRSRRPGALAAGVGLLVLVVLVAKPWGSASNDPVAPSGALNDRGTPSAASSPDRVAPAPVPAESPTLAGPADVIGLPSSAAIGAGRGWPVATGSAQVPVDGVSAGDLRTLEGALRGLDFPPAGWGIAEAGAGPRLERDESWADWTAAAATPAGGAPERLIPWPGSGLCRGLPILDAGPLLVGVSVPVARSRGARLEGWWTDGARSAPLARSVRQVTFGRLSGLLLLERVDGTPWPGGRYELHAIAGRRTVALDFCL